MNLPIPKLLTLVTMLAAFLPLPGQAGEEVDYDDPAAWLCRPDNPRYCDTDLNATVVEADGSTHRESWERNEEAEIDCFYVYPTVSRDTTLNSDLAPGPGEINMIRAQFARFGSQCRVFAPLYRQVTLTALREAMAEGGEFGANADRAMAYRDVLRAWNHYLENDNQGRGVVLIGHSQGAGILSRLIPAEVEGTPVQEQVISALLIGTNIQVPTGADVGGTFQSMPLCRSGEQLGCVVSYASFRATSPPPANSLFGRGGEGTVAACTNPAKLAGDDESLHAYLSNTSIVESASAPPGPWTTSDNAVDTPFVSVPGLLSARCVSGKHGNYLAVTVHGEPEDPRIDDIPGDVVVGGKTQLPWGLHLVDMAITMGDLIDLVGLQAQHYLAREQ